MEPTVPFADKNTPAGLVDYGESTHTTLAQKLDELGPIELLQATFPDCSVAQLAHAYTTCDRNMAKTMDYIILHTPALSAVDRLVNKIEQRRLERKISLLPKRIMLVRHGESEGNVDVSIYRTEGDAQLELTANGWEQAQKAGVLYLFQN
jgi:phosphohistidine phosphatase SixA